MKHSAKVSLIGLVVGVVGAVLSNDVGELAGFIILSAGVVCKSIEDAVKKLEDIR